MVYDAQLCEGGLADSGRHVRGRHVTQPSREPQIQPRVYIDQMVHQVECCAAANCVTFGGGDVATRKQCITVGFKDWFEANILSRVHHPGQPPCQCCTLLSSAVPATSMTTQHVVHAPTAHTTTGKHAQAELAAAQLMPMAHQTQDVLIASCNSPLQGHILPGVNRHCRTLQPTQEHVRDIMQAHSHRGPQKPKICIL